ncbi:TetR/AcrR family transcriptional regulator [Myceligenerans pegani]|uniref:Helix-turn-helix transcriptional regulator n=1 Tax=Myceligenerans pegani TaxID=2776917 RepID=A0ABR9MWP8_9MICO|nr:TetR/AcrR family transcriptional regulator [Myceligenerans sp. TRM 65318]MBE1875545.1 helix-turn-helix transcriptional regulator [Myceligenerans sp. TRM 65318]MBE3017816.1 helix-turn-helix transcriptional regulator [Myceligenerans sp. TRM 65318]
MASPRANLGPAAAARNRAALLAAARAVFSELGPHAPLNAVARAAGVGQGSLYRHFPDRQALVLALFEEQVAALEERAADPTADLADLLGLVTRHAIDSVVIIDIASATPDAPPDPRLMELRGRVSAVLGSRLPAAVATGDAPPGATVDDALLAVELVATALTRRPAGERATYAARAWQLLGFRVTSAPPRG